MVNSIHKLTNFIVQSVAKPMTIAFLENQVVQVFESVAEPIGKLVLYLVGKPQVVMLRLFRILFQKPH